MSDALSPNWRTAVEAFEAQDVAAAAASRARLTRIRRFALDVGGDPWRVGQSTYDAWIAQLKASPEAVKKYKQSLRVFYRWGIVAGYITESPISGRPLSAYSTDDRWRDALQQFEKHQRGAGRVPELVKIRMEHVRRFARDTALQPWSVTRDDYAAWIASLDCADRTRAKYRDSLRTFYRWAYGTAMIEADPTDEPDRRRTKVAPPAMWEAPLREWRTWMRMAGHPETTVGLRLHQIGRLARDHASLDPWAVTLDDLVEWLAAKQWSNDTRRGARSALRSFYGWALDTGRIDYDPSAKLPRVRPDKAQPRPVLDHEYTAALRLAEPSDRLALRLAAELGMRCAEVAVVHARDLFETSEGWCLIVHGKGSKERTLPVPDPLANLLRDAEGYVFPGKADGHISPHWMSKRISKLLPPGTTMHKLRHRFATRVYNVDRDVFTVQQLLGHASPATTQRYVLVNDDAKRRLVSAVSG